jgi:hypothetical protein
MKVLSQKKTLRSQRRRRDNKLRITTMKMRMMSPSKRREVEALEVKKMARMRMMKMRRAKMKTVDAEMDDGIDKDELKALQKEAAGMELSGTRRTRGGARSAAPQ